jgi:flagellar motility protein MotE (MotC chaperone)
MKSLPCGIIESEATMIDENNANPEPEPEVKPPKKKTMLWFVLFLIVSFNVVFFGMWTVMKKKPAPALPIAAPADSTQAAAGSTRAAADTLRTAADTTAVKTEINSTDTTAVDTTQADTLAENQGTQNLRAEEQLMALRDRLHEKQSQLQELPQILKQNEELTQENSHLKSETEEKNKRIQYYEQAMFDFIAKKLVEAQTAEAAKTAKTKADTQTDRTSATAMNQPADTSRTRQAGIRKLAKIYEAMTPQQAAAILSRMDDQSIIDILWKMKQREAAKVLASFDPVRASRLSERLGGGKPSS